MMKVTNRKIALAIPLTWTHIPVAFFDSFSIMEKSDCLYMRQSNGALADLRNDLVKTSLNNGCSHIIMMDTDQIYPADTIPKLLSHKKPIVGCLIHRRYPPFDPLIMTGELNDWKRITEWEDGELLKVDATGTGCLLLESWIFDKIPFPWFEFKKNPDTKLGGIIGEDIWFCHQVKQTGIPIYVDTSVKCGHLAYLNVTEKTYRTYQKVSEEDL